MSYLDYKQDNDPFMWGVVIIIVLVIVVAIVGSI